MALSAEWTKMQQELKFSVVPVLRAAGFRGSFPHFRRQMPEKTDLISFLSYNQSGGAFEVGASIIFTHAQNPRETNLYWPDAPVSSRKLQWSDGRIRHGLPGVHSGAFFYVDTYRRRLPLPETYNEHYLYEAVTPKNEKYILEHLKANHFELVIKADEAIYQKTASLVLEQLDGLFSWFCEMKTFRDLDLWQKGSEPELQSATDK